MGVSRKQPMEETPAFPIGDRTGMNSLPFQDLQSGPWQEQLSKYPRTSSLQHSMSGWHTFLKLHIQNMTLILEEHTTYMDP